MSYSMQVNTGLFSSFKSMSLGLMCGLGALATVTGCSQPTSELTEQPSQSTTQTEADSNNQSSATGETYTVITQPDFVPFVFRGKDGTVTGFDIEVINAIADNQGFAIDVITLPQDKLFNNVMSGSYDIVASSVSITDERKEKMAFSTPYFESRQTILLNDSVPEVASFKELTNYKIGVKEDTTSDKILQEVFVDNKDHLKHVDTLFIGVRSVISGDLDGVMSDSGVMQHYRREHADAKIHLFTDPSYPVEYYGFVVSKDRDDDLLEKINTGLAEIKSNGTYQKIVEHWFGDGFVNVN